MIKPMMVGFLLLEVDATLGDDVRFENTCTVSGKGNLSRAISITLWIDI